MAKKKYYAVRVGKVPGIYSTWEQCKEQIDGVSGAKHQSFTTLEEAERYIQRIAEENFAVDQDDVAASSEDMNAQVVYKSL